jgi:replicative DNA helicase
MRSELNELHDRQLEETVLSCALVCPDELSNPWAQMPSEVFYLESHRLIWDELNTFVKSSKGFDLAAFIHQLRLKGRYDLVQTTLGCVQNQFVASSFTPYTLWSSEYAKQLKSLYVKREKAKALGVYQMALAKNANDVDARLELEAVLLVLDSFLEPDQIDNDHELAMLIGEASKFPTGITDFDKDVKGLAAPGYNILAARPSVGKSAFARTVIRNAASRGVKVFWYSQDQAENQIYQLEIARMYNINSNNVSKMPLEERILAISNVKNKIWKNNVHLIARTLELSKLVSAIKLANPEFVVIDYLQIIPTGHTDEYAQITAASVALKSLAAELQIPFLILAQFNRQHKPGEVPQLSWLKGSGQIEADADMILGLDRDLQDPSGVSMVYVLKNKVGPTTSVSLKWNGKYASYEGIAPSYYD